MLVLILNTVFTGLIPICFSVIAAKTYIKNSVPNALYMCCGMLILGLGSICTGISVYLPQFSANVSVTIYNTCAFVSAFLSILSSGFDSHSPNKYTKPILLFALSVSIAFLTTLAYSAIHGLIPPFVDNNGFTAIRYIVLYAAIAHFLAAALAYFKHYKKVQTKALFWYSIALLMLALGLFGVCIAKSVGNLLCWTGRCAQYIGAVYALLAIIALLRDAQNTNSKTADILAEFFSDSEGNYKSLVNSSPNAVLSIDKDFNVFTANPSAKKLLKTNFIQAGERSFLTYLKEPCKTQVKEDLTNYIRSGASHLIGRTFDMEAIDTAGLAIPIEISFSSRKLSHNIAITLIMRDISERKRIELSLKQSERNALALVDELKKSDAEKNKFLSILSHELRNPLAVIVASLSLLNLTDTSNDTKGIREILERQTDHLKKLIDDLLDLTRIANNKINLKKEIVDINVIAANVIKDYTSQFSDNGISLTSNLNNEKLFINADPLRISQLISNLLCNALNFTGRGKAVNLTIRKDKTDVIVNVKDEGIGIDASVLPNIFEAFVQANNPFLQANNGLGLGLSIAKNIADLHGGTIHAYSEGQGKGALFTVRLPLVNSVTDIPTRITESTLQSQPLKILIIDDNKDYATISSQILKRMGFTSKAATSGTEGIDISKEFTPDVILCDIGLPGMNGYEVARKIRSENLQKDVSLIAVTGFAGEDDQSRIKEAGFDMHLAKPVDFSYLQQILANIGRS